MNLSSTRCISVVGGALLALLLCAGPVTAHATERLQGLVLSVDPRADVAVVRHDASGSMPSMTMRFRLDPSDARKLRSGERIDAAVDEETEPWSLLDVHVVADVQLPLQAVHEVTALKVGDAVPPTSFIDQRGEQTSFADFRGKTVVLAFIYTRCADPRECPLISANFRVLQRKLGGGAFHLVEVTLDPEFDRPGVLAAYGRGFGAEYQRWTLATGEPEGVLDFAARFGVTAFADQRVGLIHPERTAIVDPTGKIRYFIDEAAWSPDEVAAEARAVSNLPSSPLMRLDLWLSAAAVAVCGNSVAGYSGLFDLAIVLVIFTGCSWLLYRIARVIFASDG